MATNLNDFQLGYQAGFKDGFEAGLAQRQAAAPIAKSVNIERNKPARKQPRQGTGLAKRCEMVSEYLREHPGPRFRELNRDLPKNVAMTVYTLLETGKVRKDENGRFYLIP